MVLAQDFVHNLNCKSCPGTSTLLPPKLLPQYSLVRKVLADREVPGKNIGSNKCTGTNVCRKPEVKILVPVHELSPDFC